jgi:branched-chain amino acid transport system substrate-binding protein
VSRFAPLLLGLTLACGGSSAPIVIGSGGPWATQPYAQAAKQGIELALAEVNERGGIAGRRVEWRARDDEANAAKAAEIANEFLASPEVVAVVGHVNSGAMVAAARVYDGGLPAVAISTSSPDLTGISPWVFRVISSDSVNGLDAARFAQRMSFKSAAVIYENDSFGRGFADAFKRAYRGQLIAIDPVPSDSIADYEPYIAYLKARRPDLVLMVTVEGPGVALLREARRQQLGAAILGSDGWSGMTKYPTDANGIYVAQPFTATDPRPDAQRFVRAFQSKYGTPPNANAALGYDAMMVVIDAIKAVGTDRARIREYLASSLTRPAYAGVTGAIAFDSTGDVRNKPFTMTRLEGSEFVVVTPGTAP